HARLRRQRKRPGQVSVTCGERSQAVERTGQAIADPSQKPAIVIGQKDAVVRLERRQLSLREDRTERKRLFQAQPMVLDGHRGKARWSRAACTAPLMLMMTGVLWWDRAISTHAAPIRKRERRARRRSRPSGS